MVVTWVISVWVVTGACAVGRVNKASFQILSYLSLFMTSSTSGLVLISFLAGERSVLRQTSLYLMIVVNGRSKWALQDDRLYFNKKIYEGIDCSTPTLTDNSLLPSHIQECYDRPIINCTLS